MDLTSSQMAHLCVCPLIDTDEIIKWHCLIPLDKAKNRLVEEKEKPELSEKNVRIVLLLFFLNQFTGIP